MSVNHGGGVVFSAADLTLKPVPVDQPSTFELICVHAVAGQFAAIIAVVYRPGSAPVQQSYFDELGAVLEQLATYAAPVYITGDFNIRLDRPDDPHSVQLHSLVNCSGLTLHHTAATATHQLGGILDAVMTTEDAGCPGRVDVVDVGFSDHHLLCWEVSATRVTPPSVPVCSRAWRRLDLELFRSLLSTSRLCQPDDWPDIDDMAALYNSELTAQLDRILPIRQFVRQQRPSDPRFDKDCRAAKCLTRRLEPCVFCRKSSGHCCDNFRQFR